MHLFVMFFSLSLFEVHCVCTESLINNCTFTVLLNINNFSTKPNILRFDYFSGNMIRSKQVL